MWRTLRVRVALGYGLGVLALLAGLSLLLAAVAASASLHEQTKSLKTVAHNTAVMLAEGLDERRREVQSLADNPPAGNLAAWSRTLDLMQRGRPQYSWAGIVRPDGEVVAATGGLLQGRNVAERPWFQAGLKQPYVGDVHKAKLLSSLLPAPTGGEPLRFIDFAAPVRDASGALVAVLGVHATFEWVANTVAGLHSVAARQRSVKVYILDRSGQVIHRPAGDESQTAPPAALDRGPGSVQTWSDGEDYLTASEPLGARHASADLGWTIVARQTLDAATAPARQAREVALVAGGVAALLATALAWALAGRFSAPLVRIAAAAQAVHAGQLETQIPQLRGSQEMENLSGALRGMTTALLQREAELARRVEERTAALMRAQQQLQKVNLELQALATRDALTGLHNRRAGDERLRQELTRHRRSGQPLALVLADIDHFKAVNDRHGHNAGDEVLRAVAQMLASQVRATDLVVRQGGEEFLLLMPETGAEGARAACDKLRLAVAAMGGRIPVTLSLGVCVPAQELDSIEAMLEAADRALYAAKQGGRNRVVLAGDPVVPPVAAPASAETAAA